MSELIEGLPDAVALRCLARVPLHLHPKLELVSHSWRAAVRSSEIFKVRKEVLSTEEFLCVCAYDPNNFWQLYDPRHDLWISLPVLPSNVKNLSQFGVVSTSGRLFVLGGHSDAVDLKTGDHDGKYATDEVWSYDPVTRKWALCAPMIVPRATFACCVLDGKIVVAGGFTSKRKSISKAEMYDPESNVWVSIPDLHNSNNTACSGMVIDGKVHVLHKGLSTVQVLESTTQGWMVHDYSWLQGPMAIVKGKVYVMIHGMIYRQERESKKPIIALASEFRQRIGSALIGLGDDIYMVGGLKGPVENAWNIRPISDVNVLSLGSERPIWRQVAPMTRCRGTILGCTQLRI